MGLSEEVELLRNIPLFAKIEPAKLKLLAFTSERLTFASGQELFHQGDSGDATYIIIRGAAEILIDSDTRMSWHSMKWFALLQSRRHSWIACPGRCLWVLTIPRPVTFPSSASSPRPLTELATGISRSTLPVLSPVTRWTMSLNATI